MNPIATFLTRLLSACFLWVTLVLPQAGAATAPTNDIPLAAKPGWGTGQSQLSPALMLSILETKARLAARTAYLQTEGLAYGAHVSEAAQSERDTAAGLFSYLDSRGGYVDSLRGSDLTVLPVGLRKALGSGNGSLEIGILKVRFLADRALLTVYVRLKIPSPDPNSSIKERELFFGADDVVFSRDGGLAGDFKLVLLGDFVQPLGNMTLRFIGGLNRYTGATDALTYATVSCVKLVGLGVAAEVIFERSLVVPINIQTGEVIPDIRVSARFRVDAPEFGDLLADISFSQPFAITKYPKFGFALTGASLDLSDTRNSPGVVFPPGYFDNPQNQVADAAPGNSNWRGVYIDAFKLILPKEFKPADSPGRLSIDANHLLFDRQGVSGQIGMHRPTNPYGMTASGWSMSLSDFELNVEKSRLIGGAFGGFLKLPIAPDTPIRYDGHIDDSDNYGLHLTNVSTLSVAMWRAQADLLPNSTVELNVVDGEFKPRAILHGKLGIYTNTSGSQKTKDDAQFKFEGINFTGLVLQTERPYIRASSFGYEGDVKLAGFPVTIHQIDALFQGDSVGLRLNMEVNLMEGSFGAQAGFTVLGAIETGSVHRWSFKRVKLSEICVGGTTSTFSLKGCVEIFENDARYGTGFRGSIDFGMTKPAKVQVNVAAMFGTRDYRYWYVSGGASVPNIPLVGPLQINYLYAGAYYHMKPVPSPTVAYEPDNSFGLGFKGGMGLVAVSNDLFEGSAGFEMLFNKSGGLNSVGLYGDCAFTAGRKDKTDNASFFAAKQSILYSQPYKTAQTFDNAELDRKAKVEYQAASNASKAPLYARLALLYDNQNRIFKGTSDAYVNIDNIVYGGGPGNRMGLIDLYFSPDQWHIYIGTIAQPFDLTINFGVKATTRAYMMAGYGIPEMPRPPAEVLSVIGRDLKQTRTSGEKQDITLGRGFAFGASMNVKLGGCAWVGCLEAQALAGFDIMLRDYPGTYCGRTPIGVNGWYGRGQIYALANAGLSVFGFKLISASAAVLLEGGVPNPSWFRGTLAAQVKLLFIKPRLSFGIQSGQVCAL
ncbi:hypothetical protein [Spirosoma areae]